MHLFFLLFILCLFESVFSQEKFEAEIQIKSDSTNPIKLCSQDKTCVELIRINETHRNNRVDTVKFSMVDSSINSLVVDRKTLISYDGRKLGSLISKVKLFRVYKQILIHSDSTIVNIENPKKTNQWIFKTNNDTVMEFEYSYNKKSKTYFLTADFDPKNQHAAIAIQLWIMEFYYRHIENSENSNSPYIQGFFMGMLSGLL